MRYRFAMKKTGAGRQAWRVALVFALALGAAAGRPAVACGPASDCDVGARSYRIAMPPERGDGPVGAIVYIHGYKGSAAAAMANEDLRRVAADLGVALIAADSVGDDWALPHSPASVGMSDPPDGSAEIAYFEALVADAARRFPIDRGRLMVTGFSAGGMMVWTLACRRSALFAGFAPISGTFWRPIPDACPSPAANLLHIHGTSDPVVPLTGRAIGEAHQGDVRKALAMYRAQGRFGDAIERAGDGLSCTRWSNPAGKALALCLHEGGHRFRGRYVARAWRTLARIGAFSP